MYATSANDRRFQATEATYSIPKRGKPSAAGPGITGHCEQQRRPAHQQAGEGRGYLRCSPFLPSRCSRRGRRPGVGRYNDIRFSVSVSLGLGGTPSLGLGSQGLQRSGKHSGIQQTAAQPSSILRLVPILDGTTVLYSFWNTPDVKVGLAFGIGNQTSVPATELPGVSSWLEKLLKDTLIRTLVEPRRRCYALPAVDLKKHAVGGIFSQGAFRERSQVQTKLCEVEFIWEFSTSSQSSSFKVAKVRWTDDEEIEFICPSLNWATRFNVALGIAQGLAYLHEECREYIIHCDIKPENVLLNDRFCAKVSDFGLAKLLTQDETRAITAVRGTWGYLAPAWLADSPLTVQADVFSFGKVLLEIIGGRRNFEISVTTDQQNCSGLVWLQVAGSWYVNVMDDRLQGVFDLEQAERATRAGFWCIQDDPDLHPSMGKVVRMLEGVVEVPAPPIPKSLKEYDPELSLSNQPTPYREIMPLISNSKELRSLV